MRQSGWAVGVIGVLLTGCGASGTKTEASAETRPAAGATLDAGDEFTISSVQGDLKTGQERLKSGDLMGALMSCATASKQADNMAAKAAIAKHPTVVGLIKDVETICRHDVPLGALEQVTAKAEAARKAQKGGVLSECYSAEMKMAGDVLEKYNASDAGLKAVQARWAKACPLK